MTGPEGDAVPGPDPQTLPTLDSPPKSGVFVDHDDEPLTAEQITLGNALGAVIDISDDHDQSGGLL